MKDYKISKKQIERLENACFINNPDIRKEAVDKIITEINPLESELLKVEVGKYYHYKDSLNVDFIFKVTKLKEKEGVYYGYGVDVEDNIFDTCDWIGVEDATKDDLLEIDRFEFLSYVKNYAEKVLGFVEGASFDNQNIYSFYGGQYIAKGDIEILNDAEELQIPISDIYKGTIFLDGKFATITCEEPVKDYTPLVWDYTPVVWEKTMDLRWTKEYNANSYLSGLHEKVLQQKLIEKRTGEEKWVNVS